MGQNRSEAASFFPITRRIEIQRENLPREFSQAVKNAVINAKLDNKSATNAELIISNWVADLLCAVNFLLKNAKNMNDENFYSEFVQGLLDFIKHPDHGIMHSYYVYQGILYLSKLDKQPIILGSKEDQRAQLFSFLHDIMQIVPNPLGDRLVKTSPKNDHARIIAVMVKLFGQKLGFNPKEVKDLHFGLSIHDISYQEKDYIAKYGEKLNYIYQLGHDSDKTLGASLDTKPKTQVTKMVKRNYLANRGPNGSYLVRTDLTDSHRNETKYGEYGFSDAGAIVRKELRIKMFTQAAQDIANKRREAADRQIVSEYTHFYDLAKQYIDQHIIPILGIENSNIKFEITGMDQETRQIAIPENIKELEKLLIELYNTPIKIKNGHKFYPKYTDNDARGLKIHVINPGAENPDDKDIYLDPSIARFCFMKNGREEFRKEIAKVFGIKMKSRPRLHTSQTTQRRPSAARPTQQNLAHSFQPGID